MGNRHRIMSIILTGLLALSLLAPAQPVAAAEPFALVSMRPMSGIVDRMDGDVQIIPRDMGLRLEFNHPVDPATIAGAVTVTDSNGGDAGWTAQRDFIDSFVSLQTNGTQPKNATFTIRVKGGAAGLRDTEGGTLAADLTLTVRTNENAVQTAVDIPSHWGRTGLVQSEIYRVRVAAGPLRIVLSDLAPDRTVRVVLESEATGEALANEEVRAGYPALERYVPAGTYSVALVPNMARAVTLHGMDLEVSGQIPGLRLPEMEPFATQNEPFTFQPELLNSQSAASLKLLLGEQTLAENLLRADGTVAPVAVDAASLEDGLYVLTGLAPAKAAGNLAISARTFLVDRVDSFGDVPAGHWARRYIEIMRHIGILNGRSEGQFAPGQPVTRAEFAKMLALALGLEASGQEAAPFADVPDDWSKPYVDALYEHGLIQGDTVDGQRYYYPARTITRAEAATIVGRVLGVADGDLDGQQAGFIDASSIPDWARPSVVLLAEMKWINGFPDGRYQPMATLQRDQAARILSNFIGVR